MRHVYRRWSREAGFALFLLAGSASAAQATPYLVMDVRSGNVVMQQEATRRWYPASLTKLVTVYAALQAVKQGRVTLDTPLVVSTRAAHMPPSKMGFKPGTEITLDNALKMLMVKSANDLAITIAEGLGGTVEGFADQMNAVAAQLGMNDSHFVNPNGLHDDNHYSSARDMALVGRALYRDFPEHADLYGIGALRLGSQIIPTHNGLMGRYPGADGMKTGFTCPAGFNVVASATRGGRQLIAVVLGYPTAKSRTLKTASLLDTAFAAGGSGSTPAAALPSTPGAPPNMRPQVCGPHRQDVAEDDFAVPVAPGQQAQGEGDHPAAFFATQGLAAPASSVEAIQAQLGTRPYFEPIPVYIGRAPGYTGPVLAARGDAAPPPKQRPGASGVGSAVSAAIAESSEPKAATHHAKRKPKVATAKQDASKPVAKFPAKPAKPKSAPAKHKPAGA